jgi:glycosyltransferase involved in cell wall biosynthesis
MKIAQIAPLYESVPPKLYGGTERIVSYLTEELVRQGHQVTLFASGDSITAARLIATTKMGLRLGRYKDQMAPHISQLYDVMGMADQFDILHFHTDYLHFPATQRLNIPCVTTLHGRLDMPEVKGVYQRYNSQLLISISASQKLALKKANWLGTVHHGIPENWLLPGKGQGDYLAFIGRVSPEKGLDRAIEIAIRSNKKIRIAAKVDPADIRYYNDRIKSMLDHPLVEFIGEINESEKNMFLGNAEALLFPINWPEPFGLVLIEAMACGTPVIAFNRGSVPEIVKDRINGYIVATTEEGVSAVGKVAEISRETVRKTFEEKFTVSRMADDYLDLYRSVIKNHKYAGVFPYSSFISNEQKGNFIIRGKS